MDAILKIQTCRLIEQMDQYPEVAKQLGMEITSVSYGGREKTNDIKEEQQT